MLSITKCPSLCRCVLLLITAAVVGACSSSTALTREMLDPVTSVTITYIEQPLVFYRDVRGRDAFAKDYVYVAPVEVNRSGDHRYYIWLGVWTGNGTGSANSGPEGFASITLLADGVPVELEIAGWRPDTIGASEPVYAKPAASAADAYYELTFDQLRLLAEADEIRLQTSGNDPAMFEPWDDQRRGKAALLEFLNGPIY